jgi:acyl-CoA synthetase (AMP-forming)/AMP-acid ligase II
MQMHDVIAASAARWPRRAAIVDEWGTLDFQTLAEQVELARRALVDLGAGPGTGVGLMAQNGRGFVVGAFGALAAGATLMPISHQLAPAEVRSLLAEAPVHLLVDDGSGARVLEPARREVALPGGPILRVRPGDRPRASPFADGIPGAAFVRFTSGTTGAAKGVVITHRGMLERTAAANAGLGLGPDDTVIWVLQMAFHFVVSVALYLRYGATMAVTRDHLAETILEVSNRHQGTLLYASPLHYRGLASDRSGVRFTTLERAISTSTALPEGVAQAFLARHGLPVTQAYGIIEVGLPLMNLRRAREAPLAVGDPLPDYEVAILGPDLAPLARGLEGELAMRGPGMFEAYLSPARRRDEVLRGGWFLTGDLARQDPDGLVTVVGRRKAMINVAGNKVFPEEVESVLDAHPAVERSRVSGRPHPRMGEVLHAEVVLRDPAQPIAPDDLIEWCRGRLSAFRVPFSLELRDHLATTASEKLARGSAP